MRAIVLVIALASCGGRSESERPALTPSQPTQPAWFGLPDAPNRRIAGQLSDGASPLAGTVHLRIDAPDATIWRGIDRVVGPDGRFDFGELRAGRYNILATAPGKTSRLVEVDTRSAAATDVTIFAFACTSRSSRVVTAAGAPIANAQIDIGGVVVATTDTSGAFSLCINEEWMAPTVRAPGYAVDQVIMFEGNIFGDVKLEPTIALAGRVIDAKRRPVAHVAVQPAYVPQVFQSHGSAYGEVHVQATTDADGRFVLRGIPAMDAATGRFGERARPAQYTFRVIDHEMLREDRSATATAPSSRAVVVDVSKAIAVAGDHELLDSDTKISGRVLHRGKPLADAMVSYLAGYTSQPQTRTRADGTFDLPVWGGSRLMLVVEHATGVSTNREIEVADGQHVEGVVIDIAPMEPIEGVFVDALGAPRKGVAVWVKSRDTAVRRYDDTGTDGTFSIEVEAGHTYDLEATDGNTGVTFEKEIKVDAPGSAKGLRFVIGGARPLEVVVVDEAGAPVKGARLVTNDPTFEKLSDGASRAKAPWTPKGAKLRSVTLVSSSLFVQDVTTDAAGRVSWAPIGDAARSIVVLSADGRVGAADNVTAASSPVRITVQRPGAIQITCTNIAGGVTVVAAQRRFDVGCGETLGEMPAGRYVVTSKAASVEVDVRPDATTNAVLEVKPAGRIK